MTEKKKAKRRIEIVDVAKCFAIFMVILGHTATNDELLGNPPVLIKVLYSIHMPLFFFLSGMSISLKPLKGWQEWRFFLRKNVLTIAIPYLLWALIYCSFNFENLGWILYGSWSALGKTGTVTSLWYLSCLFVARFLVQGVIQAVSWKGRKSRRGDYLIPTAVCLAAGALFPDIDIGYPWCVNVAFVAAGFILLGIALKHVMIGVSVQKGWVLFACLGACAGLYILLAVLQGDGFGVMMMCKGAYGQPLFSLGYTLLGGFAVGLLAMLAKRLADEWLPRLELKSLIYLGQHTMGVFLLHKPLLQNIFLPFLKNLLGGGPDILVRLAATVLALTVSIWLCRLIEYYIPELVGIFSRDIISGGNKA